MLVGDFDFTRVVFEKLVDGRTDLLAVRSGKFKALHNGYLGVLGALERGVRDIDSVNGIGLRPWALRSLRPSPGYRIPI